MKSKIIILNSPPDTGKDTIAEAYVKRTGSLHKQFKSHLYKCTATLFNIDLDMFINMATDRASKEMPDNRLYINRDSCRMLKGYMRDDFDWNRESEIGTYLSPREALIFTSELVIKPMFGCEYFGDIAAESIDIANGTIFSDGGFNEELIPVVETWGRDCVYIVQFTRGDKVDFTGDSRGWLNPPKGVKLLRTTNDHTVEDMVDKIVEFVGDD